MSMRHLTRTTQVSRKEKHVLLRKWHGLYEITGARGKSGSNDASAEYLAALRKVMDDANVTYQTSELGKVDAGGGGTIAISWAIMA